MIKLLILLVLKSNKSKLLTNTLKLSTNLMTILNTKNAAITLMKITPTTLLPMYTTKSKQLMLAAHAAITEKSNLLKK